jgi:hypothetical protein
MYWVYLTPSSKVESQGVKYRIQQAAGKISADGGFHFMLNVDSF